MPTSATTPQKRNRRLMRFFGRASLRSIYWNTCRSCYLKNSGKSRGLRWFRCSICWNCRIGVIIPKFTLETLRYVVLLLILAATTLLLLACGKTVLAKKGDKNIWLKAHSSYPNTPPYWKKNELEYKAYFGKYTHFDDLFNDYYGDPLGPVAAIWSVTRYLGEEPKFKDCKDEPKYPSPPSGMSISSPEFKKIIKESYSKPRKKYYSCLDDNEALKQKSKTTTYYYARSTNNYLPILPKRSKNHALYDIHMSFGPMGGIVERGLTEEEKIKKDQLFSESCHRYGKDDTCYRLPGEDNNLYYTVRSVFKAEKNPDSKKASSAWKVTKFIREEPHKWEEIKGIEITKAQYEYMQLRCKGVFSCFLDDKAQELTAEQKVYIKDTSWDIDTDEKALKALVKKSEKFRHDK